MKPRVYFLVLALIVPFQASVLNLLSFAGVKPDLPLALLYIIGLLTGPMEAALAGVGIGLVQDIGSANFIGFNGFTRGLVGLGAGFLGTRMLDLAGPSNGIFLAAFSLLEGIAIAIIIQVIYGTVPFFSLFFTQMLPQALYTGVLGVLLLRYAARKDVLSWMLRRSLQKE